MDRLLDHKLALSAVDAFYHHIPVGTSLHYKAVPYFPLTRYKNRLIGIMQGFRVVTKCLS